MATSTKSDKSDIEPEPQSDVSPETDIPVAAEPESDKSDNQPEEPETVIPELPADFKPESAYVSEFHKMVIQAEEHKDDPTPRADFVAKADELFNLPTGFDVVLSLPDTDIEAGMATMAAFKDLVDTVRKHVETVDRDLGDQLANGLESLVNMPFGDIKSESDKAAIPILVARWAQSAPKSAKKGKSGGSRNNGQPSLIPLLRDVWGFRTEYRVVSICGVCGKKVTTEKDNLNSQRNACIDHSGKECPTRSNKGNGTNAYQELTKSLYQLGMGNSDWKGKHVEKDNLLDKSTGGGWSHSVKKS